MTTVGCESFYSLHFIMGAYLHCAWHIMNSFIAFNIVNISVYVIRQLEIVYHSIDVANMLE